jgi:uncharacterized protein YcaQ
VLDVCIRFDTLGDIMPPALPSPLPLSAVRALALDAQGLTTPNGAESDPTPDRIHSAVERVGCVQIDTLHLVRRSQYLVLWSRLGHYDPADFDRLIYHPDQRRLFEYWKHAASIIPLSEYRYRQETMRYFRDKGGWWSDWRSNPDNTALVQQVLERVRVEGPLRTADFESDGHQRGTWWDWKPAKHALEYLYDVGDLMIADRVNFQRVYDLRERVLPGWVENTPLSADEVRGHEIERAALALGIAQAGQIADYAYMKRGEGAPAIQELLAEGVLFEVEVELASGEAGTLVVHRDTLPRLEQAADGAIRPARTTFLSPFDSLFWTRNRDQQVWGFRQTLEAYTPEPKRIWGYFCLPILHHDRLVGRFDPKLERKTGTLRLKALYLEPGIELADDLIADVAGALRDFMTWHEAHDLVIERSDPAEFGPKLLGAL